MSTIKAFRGIRFTKKNITDSICPPYDVISKEEKAKLKKKSKSNIVNVELPDSKGNRNKYVNASAIFSEVTLVCQPKFNAAPAVPNPLAIGSWLSAKTRTIFGKLIKAISQQVLPPAETPKSAQAINSGIFATFRTIRIPNCEFRIADCKTSKWGLLAPTTTTASSLSTFTCCSALMAFKV